MLEPGWDIQILMNAPIFHRELAQMSPEWFRLHCGKVTASQFKNIMTSEFELRKGETLKGYLHEKVAEKWRGQLQSAPSASSFAMDQGIILEDEAIPWLELEYDYEIQRVGFIESADGRCGCSPDGMIADDHGLEIKCPFAKTHVGYLLENRVPLDYVTQVHGSIFVSGAQRWTFVSYRRGFPNLVLTVERDEAVMMKIHSSLTCFFELFDAAMERIRELAEGGAK